MTAMWPICHGVSCRILQSRRHFYKTRQAQPQKSRSELPMRCGRYIMQWTPPTWTIIHMNKRPHEASSTQSIVHTKHRPHSVSSTRNTVLPRAVRPASSTVRCSLDAHTTSPVSVVTRLVRGRRSRHRAAFTPSRGSAWPATIPTRRPLRVLACTIPVHCATSRRGRARTPAVSGTISPC